MADVLKSHSVMIIKATMLANLLSLLLGKDGYTSLDELQVSNDLQYCFKIFSGDSQTTADQNGVCVFSILM